MKIIVTGGAGFIGSNLVRFLIQEMSHEVLVLDKLTYAGNLKSLENLSDHSGFQIKVADICSAKLMTAAFDEFQPDAIMHLAAESHVDRSIHEPETFVQTNVLGTFQLLHAARQYYNRLPSGRRDKFRFLHVSTDEVYGSLAIGDAPFSESTPYDPHSPYSASKASSDHFARAWHDTYGLPVLITNCSNNYGPFQFPEKLIPVVILKALSGEDIPIYGNGENVRDWLYVNDHVRALLAVLTQGRVGQTYNIGGNNEQTNISIVKKICGILDDLSPVEENAEAKSKRPSLKHYEELIKFVPDRPSHDLRYAINTSKIECELNWKPQHNFESGIRTTVTWYLENEPWWRDILTGEYKSNL